jgi:hypothetical protein
VDLSAGGVCIPIANHGGIDDSHMVQQKNSKMSGIKNVVQSKWLQYYMPFAFMLFIVVTMEREVITDEGYDRLYGFPLPHISSAYASSFSYDVYVLPLICDLAVYLGLVFFFFKILEKVGLKLRDHWVVSLTGTLIIAASIYIFYQFTSESSFMLVNDLDFKVTDRQLRFLY